MARGRKNLYDPNTFPLLAEQYARNGLSDKQIHENLGIGHNTFYNYMREHDEFREAVERGKKPVDIQVENAMLKICLGFEYEEKTTEYENINGKPSPKRTKIVKKYIAPDSAAIKFWLINRSNGIWVNKKEMEFNGQIDIDTAKYTEEEKQILLNAARKGVHIER